MKIYFCKPCMQKGKKFSGTRYDVRKHLREDHFIISGKKNISQKGEKARLVSNRTLNTLAVEIEDEAEE